MSAAQLLGAEAVGGRRAMVRAEAVRTSFGRLEVLRGIDLDVLSGQVLVLLGPSGSGKSTFLRCINHLEKIDGGRLWVDGELVGYEQRGDTLRSRSRGKRARWSSNALTPSSTASASGTERVSTRPSSAAASSSGSPSRLPSACSRG